MQKKGIWEPVLWLVSMVASHLIPRSLLRFTATKIMEHPSTPSKFFPKHLTTILLYFLLQLVPESPRFYMAAGKPEKALCILQKIAKENNKELPPGELIATEQHEVLIWILKSLSWTWQNFKKLMIRIVIFLPFQSVYQEIAFAVLLFSVALANKCDIYTFWRKCFLRNLKHSISKQSCIGD